MKKVGTIISTKSEGLLEGIVGGIGRILGAERLDKQLDFRSKDNAPP